MLFSCENSFDTESQTRSHENIMRGMLVSCENSFDTSQTRSHENIICHYFLWLCVLQLESIKPTTSIDLTQNYSLYYTIK